MVGPPLNSPDPDAIGRGHKHLVAGLNFKRVVPRIDVTGRPDHPKLPRRMRIAHDLFTHVIVRNLAAPGLRPPEHDPLIAGVTVKYRSVLSLQRSVISVEREREAAQISD